MENTIPLRISDFLKNYPPFHLLDAPALLTLSQGAQVQYKPEGERIFAQGEHPGGYNYVVREGAVALYREMEHGRQLVDQCDEGDLFGLRPLLAEEPYALTAESREETLLYALPIAGLKPVLEDHPKVAFYLASSFAAGTRRPLSGSREEAMPLHGQQLGVLEQDLTLIQAVEYSKEPVTCTLGMRIEEAARRMAAEEVGSIIILDGNRYPKGIITDKDLRREVATGRTERSAPVEEIMSSPVITMQPGLSAAHAQIAMVRHHIHHLCLTEDGSPQSAVVGVISEHDLLILQGNNPAILIREIRRTQNGSELRRIRERAEQLLHNYILQEVAISFISTVMTEVNDTLIRQVIRLAQRQMEEEGSVLPDDVAFCWLALGSEGREEQLLRTDQDSALIFRDVPEDELEPVRARFLDFAGRVTALLHEVGFAYCPANMMASNPDWCLSLSEWKRQFSRWILEPTPKAVMHCTIFFDYRPLLGDAGLAEQLTQHIFQEIDREERFLSFLAKNATENPPPLTFFRNFVVEKSGTHADQFDIKARAMMPLTDAARVLVLHNKIARVNNTFRRFDILAEREPQNRELFEQASDAYEILMRYRTMHGLKNRDSGRFFNPSDLSKMERLQLRNAFRPIRDLQSLLTTRFQLSFFN